MRRLTRNAVALVWLALGSIAARADDGPAAPDFQQHVAPLLQKYCTGCHDEASPEGGLALDSYDRLLAGGKRGVSVVPGKSAQSRLVLMLEGKTKPIMPPDGNPAPKAEEIDLLRAWVDAGAKGPSGQAPDRTRLVSPKIPLTAAARRSVSAMAVSPDGTLLAVAGYQRLRLMEVASGAVRWELESLRGNVNAVSFSADGSRLVAAAGEPGLFGEATILRAADAAVERIIVGHRDSLFTAVLSPDGSLLATAGYDERIRLWNSATGEEIRDIAGHNGAIYDLAFRPDGKVLASASADRTVKLWDIATGLRLETFGQSLKELYTLAFSPDGGAIAAAGVDNRIRVWKVSPTAQEGTNPIVHARFAHQGAILRIVWSRDGKTIASSAEDRTVKLWDAAEMRERRLLEAQPDWCGALAFSPDGAQLFAGRLDGSLSRYQVADGAAMPLPGFQAAIHAERSGLLASLLRSAFVFGAFVQQSTIQAAAPQLSAVSQRGVQRGVPTRLTLSGKELTGVTEVRANHPGIKAVVAPSTTPSAGAVTIEVTPESAVPRGTYELSVVSPGGTSNGQRLLVDDLAQLSEAEPNDGSPVTQRLPLPAGVWGLLDRPGDADRFAFTAAAGETLVFDLAAATLGSKANAVLVLSDASGRTLATNNDVAGDVDPLLVYTFAEAGEYSIRVADLALGASGEHYYRLTVGAFPFITGCYPLGIPTGKETAIELAGYNLPAGAKVTLPAAQPGEAVVPLDANLYRWRRELRVAVGPANESLEAEPNNTSETATAIALPAIVDGRLLASGAMAHVAAADDVDLFRFEAAAGQSWVIETDAARRGSPIDTRIEILDAQGRPVPRLLLQAVRDSYIEFRPIDSNGADVRLKNWEEMELNQYLYLQGEVNRLFRAPRGPDSGYVLYDSGGRRRCYFDTSPTVHALDESAYIVEPHPVGTSLIPTGLPVFTVHYANDDDGERKLGADSRLTFTAPAAGVYLVRVSDVRGHQGDRYGYRLIVREARPDFAVTLQDQPNPAVPAGSGRDLLFTVERTDGFEGEVSIDVAGLPPGFTVSSPVVIQAGHNAAKAVLYAAADAPAPTEENASTSMLLATATIGGVPVTKDVRSFGKIALAPAPKIRAMLIPENPDGSPTSEIVIEPGRSVTAMLRVQRSGFDDRISLDVENLPHGVIVDDIGLNGVLVRENETERRIFLRCAAWVPDTVRLCHAVARAEGNQSSPPVVIRVGRK